MRTFPLAVLLAAFLVAGCATTGKTDFKGVPGPSQAKVTLPAEPAPAQPAPTPAPKLAPKSAPPIVTPDTGVSGKVSRYNDAGRFVVLNFPVAQVPAIGKKLFLYRNNLKVGEVSVTGPQRDDHIVGDLTTGEAQVGDEARDK